MVARTHFATTGCGTVPSLSSTTVVLIIVSRHVLDSISFLKCSQVSLDDRLNNCGPAVLDGYSLTLVDLVASGE